MAKKRIWQQLPSGKSIPNDSNVRIIGAHAASMISPLDSFINADPLTWRI